jgi:mono/diheme cytochrome c family protein
MKLRNFPGIPFALALVAAALLWTALPGAAAAEESDTVLVSRGKVSFNLYCRSCHGAEAKGDRSVAQYLTIPPADLTKISERHGGEFPEEEIYEIIDGRDVPGHGSRDMPIWGDAFKTVTETESEEVVEEKIQALVVFLKSIQESGE